MYLTGGQFKGLKIEVPKTAKPTLSKVRESVFNILFSLDFEGNDFLDMFAGSGIMGLEAISRGYNVTSLEKNSKTIQTIKKNCEKLCIKPKIIQCDALRYSEKTFDIIYLDPPWDYEYKDIIYSAYKLLNKKGIIIIEHDSTKSIDINNILNCLKLKPQAQKQKKYGRCLIDLLTFVK